MYFKEGNVNMDVLAKKPNHRSLLKKFIHINAPAHKASKRTKKSKATKSSNLVANCPRTSFFKPSFNINKVSISLSTTLSSLVKHVLLQWFRKSECCQCRQSQNMVLESSEDFI